MNNATVQGVVYVHSTPAALRPHVEWAIEAALGKKTHLDWRPQPAQGGSWRAEIEWRGTSGTGAKLASGLRACDRIRFEVTEDTTAGGLRYAWTPSLGFFSAQTSPSGDIQLGENQLRRAMNDAANGGMPLALALSDLLGEPWDEELEVFRYAGEDDVRWLSRVG